MMQPNRPIRILLYEDKPNYADSFKTMAQQRRIIVETIDNGNELLEKIKENPRKYKFVILDARAYMQEGQAEGTEDEMNLLPIIRDIDAFKRNSNQPLPYCINTGFADLKLRLSGKVNCPIFEKGNESELLEYVWSEYQRTDDAKLIMEYPEIFDFAQQYFLDADYAILSALFQNERYFAQPIAQRTQNLADLRRIMEHLMDIINRDYLGGAAIIQGNGSRLGDICSYLHNQNQVPVHIFSTITSIRKIAGNFGSHTPTDPTAINSYPSNNLIGGLALSITDVFAWSKKLLS